MSDSLSCPKCDGQLVLVTHEHVEVDRCVECGGIWFDATEMEALLEKRT